MSRNLLAIAVFLTLSSTQAVIRAQCEQPSVTVVMGTVNENGSLSVTAHYNFGDNPGRVYYWSPFVEGYSWWDVHGAGHFEFGGPVACFAAGTYTWRAVAATACAGVEAEDSKNFVVADETPTVSFEYTGPDENGNLQIQITYGFDPQQRTYNIRKVWFFNGGNLEKDWVVTEMSGTLPHSTSVACLDGPRQLAAVAFACDRWNDPAYSAEDVQTYEANSKPEVEIVGVEPNGADGYNVSISYAFPGTAPAQRALKLEWLPSKTTAGGHIKSFTGLGTTGTVMEPITAPFDHEQIRATATACSNKTAVRDALVPAADKDCCTIPGSNFLSISESMMGSTPAACDGAPIRVSTGNMRYGDSEPLPGPTETAFARTYDSGNESSGVFGYGWTSPFDSWLRKTGGADGRESVVIGSDENDRYTFRKTSSAYSQTWPEGTVSVASLTYEAGTDTFALREPQSSVVQIYRASDGRLVKYKLLRDGNEIQITYDSGGLPQRVQDTFGRFGWTITTDSAEQRVTSISIDDRPDIVWNYEYNPDDTLEGVSLGVVPWRSYVYSNKNMTEARDGAGNLIESHSYDAAGRATTSVDANEEITSITFGTPGSVPGETITTTTFANGLVSTKYLRFIGGRIRTVRVDGGCSSCGGGDAVYGYDESGHLVRIQNARGYITANSYDAAGHLASVTTGLKPAGCDPETDPDRCRLTVDQINDPLISLDSTSATHTTNYVYGDANWPDRPTSISESSVLGSGNMRTENLSYHSVTGDLLSRTVSGWTGSPPAQQSRTTTTTLYNGSEGAAFAPGGAFDTAWLTLPQPTNSPKSTDGPRTDVTDVRQLVYYPVHTSVPATWRGRLAASKDAAANIVRIESYDVFGNPTRTVDANGVATETAYDALGRHVSSTLKGVAGCDTTADPLCSTDLVTASSYSPATGPLSQQTRANAAVTLFEYDSFGRTEMISRGPSSSDLRERIEYDFDPLTGAKSQERILANESGSWVEKKRTSFEYDAFSRLEEIVHPDSTRIIYDYDANGNVENIQDERHTAPNTFHKYDAADRLVEVRQEQVLSPGADVVTSYAYDHHGNLTSVTDPNGNVTTYVYDDFGQMLSQMSPVTGTTTYAYDVAANLTSVSDSTSRTETSTYDAANRRISTVLAKPGFSTLTDNLTYDSATAGGFGKGRLATNNTFSYSYDRRGLLRRKSQNADAQVFVTSFQYDANGNRTVFVYPSGRIARTAYDWADRPLSTGIDGKPQFITSASYLPFGPMKTLQYGTTNSAVRTMSYDNRYRMTDSVVAAGGTGISNYHYIYDGVGNITAIQDVQNSSYDRSFGYDDLNRLTVANSGASLWGSGGMTYDPMGNIVTMTLGTVRTHSFSYSGTTPKLTQVVDNLLPTASVSYDAAGNETAVGSNAYTYNARNVLRAGDGFSYMYGAERVRFRTTWDTTGESRYQVYSPEYQLIGETQVATLTGSFPFQYEYFWFGGQPVGQYDALTDTLHFTVTDHLGTPFLQMDASGAVDWRVEYAPYGLVLTPVRVGATRHQPLRLPGQEAEQFFADVGPNQNHPRNYNIFRWYRRPWGRYSQADPLGAKGDPNLFGYAQANPVTFIDPTGERSRLCCTPITGGVQPFNHCFVHVQDEGSGASNTYSLHRMSYGHGCTFEGDGFDLGALENPATLSCGDWSEGCKADACARSAYNAYPKSSQYFGLGPNSNTFASNAALLCGFDQPPIVGWKTPGWGDKTAKPHPSKQCPSSR